MPLQTTNARPAAPQQAATNDPAPPPAQNDVQRFAGFTRASHRHSEPGDTITGTLTTARPQVAYQLPAYGWLEAQFIKVTVLGNNNNAVVAFNPDAPWNFINQIVIKDPTGQAIFGPLTGHQLYMAMKWGGYRIPDPAGDTRTYNPGTTGAGAGSGNFSFFLPIYHAFARDGLGLLPNMNASAKYRVEITLGNLADIYSTAPNGAGAPSYTIQPYIMAFAPPPPTTPDGMAARQEPPAAGTIQYWTAEYFTIGGAGNQTFQLHRVGQLIRNWVFIWLDNTGARSEAVIPTTDLYIEWDTGTLHIHPPALQRFRSYMYHNLVNDTGVTNYGFIYDPDLRAGAEVCDEYLPSFGSTRFQLRFTAPAAGQLVVLTNDVRPNGNIFTIYN